MPAQSAVDDFVKALAPRVSGEVRVDAYSRMLYSTDASIYQVQPYGVMIPRHSDDVHAAVELAASYGVPILARGGGSSLAGQAVNEALVIDTSRYLNEILEVNTEEHWVRVQPGRVLDELNLHLRTSGLQFGPDPASSNRAVMGGIVSNNSTGSHSILYGMTADHVLEAKVTLADGTATTFGPLTDNELRQHQQRPGLEGEIYRKIGAMAVDDADTIRAGTPRHWRRCGGYNLDRFVDGGVSFHRAQDSRFNLARLVCGAEGTLATITELKLNLVPVPKRTALAVVHFNSLSDALTAVPVILETEPSAVELLDNLGLTMCRAVPAYARLLHSFIEGEPYCVLITEFYGESEAELQAKLERLDLHLKQQQVAATGSVQLIDPQRQKHVWAVRKAGLGLIMSIKGDHKPMAFIEDAAVPVDHLAEYVNKLEAYCNSIGTDITYYAHASAGCLHVRPLINAKQASEVAKLPDILEFAVDLLKGYGGALSSEHGDGRARSWINERFFGPELYRLYQQVKQTFDPQGILNPGMVVDAGSMTTHLRYGEAYSVIPVNAVVDFSFEGGFDRAVEMCNGAGVCRKTTSGTMCPSFMVTQEEEHSTRGRANALRAAMSGRLPTEEMTSERMYEVMDLCISCKACKAECPSSVDMAKIKLQFLADYHKTHGVPMRARFFGNIAKISRMTSGPLAGLVNFGNDNPLMRLAMHKVLGVSQKRSLPSFATEPFTAWFGRHQRTSTAAAKRVVLFNDTFNTYNYPGVSKAATEVLEALGYTVALPGHGCCGRPMMSEGLVDAAKSAAREVVDRLAPFAREGVPIVGLEPSCILALRDEYHYLIPDHPDLNLVAAQCYSFEEFIAQLAEKGELDLQFDDAQRDVLLHGHCHQKALVGMGSSVQMLSLPPNYSVQEIDSGCCGMAGSFGYEDEHYDVSMDMAERRLLPAVREVGPETIIVAAGVSCRQQIKHGTGRVALHPAEVLRDAMR